VFLIIFSTTSFIYGTQPYDNSDKNNIDRDSKTAPGLRFQASGWDYFSLGLGTGFFYKWYNGFNNYDMVGLGLILESRTDRDIYIRPFSTIFLGTDTPGFGGFGAELSGIIVPEFKNDTMIPNVRYGFSPTFHIGSLGGFFYRYNIFFDEKYNNHELGIKMHMVIFK
jgi:hypothetical protein